MPARLTASSGSAPEDGLSVPPTSKIRADAATVLSKEVMIAVSGEVLNRIAGIVLGSIVLGWLVWTTVKRAEDPARMVFKWVLTAGMFGVLFGIVGPIVGSGGYGGAFVGIPATAACGLVLAIIWRHNIAALIASPFSNLYDGGNVPPEPKPAYSIAQSKQKQGRYLEAIQEVQAQLAMFPTDLEGHMLMAQIQAENLKDLPGAEATVEEWVSQPGHAPANVAFALFSMADWHLACGKDREAAKRCFERVVELLPDSEFALSAAQRIAHVASAEKLIAHEPRTFAVPENDQHLGLLKSIRHLAPKPADLGEAAAQYVKHLEEHPQDTEAREELAKIYVDHYQRLDLAADQLEQMIQQPNQPSRLVVRWLNLLADLQVRSGCEYEAVRETLQRIVDRNPRLAAAEMARNRLAILKLELKGKQKTEDVKMGTYEQNIGLKGGPAPPHER